jgi:putative intracellular protease/amidase
MKRTIFLVAFLISLISVSSLAQTNRTSSKGNILVIVSSESSMELQGGGSYKTGYFLNELTVPVKKLVEEGYSVTFSNPQGNKPSMDIHSDSADFFNKDVLKYKQIKTFHDGLTELKSPRKLQEVIQEGLTKYDAVFFPGGHAPMQDLLKDSSVRQVLTHFHQAGKPTALICHGPISLIAAMPEPENFVEAMYQGDIKKATALATNWPYKGYEMTIFSTSEEKVSESKQLGGKMRFYPEAAMKIAGGDVRVAQPWQSQVVQDRELITGQNPFSDDALAEILLKTIKQKKKAN